MGLGGVTGRTGGGRKMGGARAMPAEANKTARVTSAVQPKCFRMRDAPEFGLPEMFGIASQRITRAGEAKQEKSRNLSVLSSQDLQWESGGMGLDKPRKNDARVNAIS
jgi:hypothetical protein